MGDGLAKGTKCFYLTRDGNNAIVTVLKVHYEESPPFYTIVADGVERQTEGGRLAPLDVWSASRATASDRPRGITNTGSDCCACHRAKSALAYLRLRSIAFDSRPQISSLSVRRWPPARRLWVSRTKPRGLKRTRSRCCALS